MHSAKNLDSDNTPTISSLKKPRNFTEKINDYFQNN